MIDPEGKAVVNATVLVRNEASADLRTAMTDATGHFSVSGLPTGIYTIEAMFCTGTITTSSRWRTGMRSRNGGRALDS